MIPIKYKPNIILNYNHTVVQINNAISHELCDSCLNNQIMNSLQLGKSKNEHLWKAQFEATLILDTNHSIYSALWKFWNDYIITTKIQIDFIEPYEVKRYNIGDFFEPHKDNYFVLDEKIDRKINLIVQLSDSNNYEGGDLIIGIGPNQFKITRNKGSVIIFPAQYIHQVTKITKGQRYSLIGHAWGPNWI